MTRTEAVLSVNIYNTLVDGGEYKGYTFSDIFDSMEADDIVEMLRLLVQRNQLEDSVGLLNSLVEMTQSLADFIVSQEK